MNHLAHSDLSETSLVCVCSHVQPFVVPWTVAHQAPLSMGFSRQEYWSGLPSPPPGDCPDPGWDPRLLHLFHLQADSLPLAPPGKPCALNIYLKSNYSSFTLLPVLYHRSGNCQGIKQAFMSAFISKDPCKATKEDYKPLLDLAYPTVPCDKVPGAKLWI